MEKIKNGLRGLFLASVIMTLGMNTAQARRRYHHRYHGRHHGRYYGGYGVGAGILGGMVLGSAIASSRKSRDYSDNRGIRRDLNRVIDAMNNQRDILEKVLDAQRGIGKRLNKLEDKVGR